MGTLLCACQRRRASDFDALGIPHEYTWEGLAYEQIDEYDDAKEKAMQELNKSSDTENVDVPWMDRIPQQSKEALKHLLLTRAMALVHVLRPIEEQRRSLHMMQNKGFLPDNHFASFQQADEQCQQELKELIEEGQLLAPELPPNNIIQSAVRLYDQQVRHKAGADEVQGRFEDVKRGFFKNASSGKKDESAHGFEIGAEVVAHSLQTASLNGARGQVLAARGDRVAVSFPAPIGEKALKPSNLKIAPPQFKSHPDATVPTAQLEVELERQRGESLGLDLNHEPPLEHQQQGQDSCLLINDILPDGFAHQYNEKQQEKESKLCRGDRIMGVVDFSIPEESRRLVTRNSAAMLSVIQSGATPLVFLILRVLGPPLRFKIDYQVKAKCGEDGWLDGQVVAVWEERDGNPVPYVISIGGADRRVVFAPCDDDVCVVKGEPRFKVGDVVMASRNEYQRGKVAAVTPTKCSTSYEIELDSGITCTAPEDTNAFVRPLARFTEGTKVLARVGSGFVPGEIVKCYHPQWVYAVKLDLGQVVFAPEDLDTFVKKQ